MNPKALLDAHDILPKKSLGQNFLHDPNALDKIVASAALTPDDTVIEVGPGTGALTARLAQTAKRVISVELDERLKPILDEQITQRYANASILYRDILTVDIAALTQLDDYVVVANVPYYITSAILRHFLEGKHRPRRMVLTVQQEVAERIVAKPDDMSILAVSVQFYGSPRIVMKLNPATFWPRPDVTSAVVRIDTYSQPPVDVPDAESFFRVVQAGFSQKRKQIKNAISSGLHLDSAETAALLEQAGIDPRRRAETLTLAEWAALTRAAALVR